MKPENTDKCFGRVIYQYFTTRRLIFQCNLYLIYWQYTIAMCSRSNYHFTAFITQIWIYNLFPAYQRVVFRAYLSTIFRWRKCGQVILFLAVYMYLTRLETLLTAQGILFYFQTLGTREKVFVPHQIFSKRHCQ